MPYGYNTVSKGDLVRVPIEIKKKAEEETYWNNMNATNYERLEKERREKERADRVRKQSNLFEIYGTRDVKEEVSYEEQQKKLTELRKQPFANKATAKMQQEAILEMSRLRDAKAKQENWAEQSRRQRERDRREDEEKKLENAKTFLTRVANTVAKTVANSLDLDYKRMGGSKSKEILGKQRRIYKVAGSRKEHVKYKGQLIPVSDYKKLMKLKR